ncbi:MAG: hypothetical protein ABIJ57_00335 [Pseudomonadota bacterium]|nr:hypothetical protein [Pseudomonadota bacterium]MBU2026903.1 hypothetical protein [Pseudomonadota bacterium]MBU3932428.1 hypothetical protein [Pseudomonadota bacterium]MBU4120389.1 hypothetical protein [Pseudomonadota bacterium]
MDHFEKLRLLLDAHPTGAPKSEVFDEILRILFSPEEAIVVCAFHYVLTVGQLCQAGFTTNWIYLAFPDALRGCFLVARVYEDGLCVSR